jgi:ATP-dependent Clp protease ATP-binding subunit ClpA
MSGGEYKRVKTSQDVDSIMHNAYTGAKDYYHEYLTKDHVFLALLDNEKAKTILEDLIDIKEAKNSVIRYLDNFPKLMNKLTVSNLQETTSFREFISFAVEKVVSSGRFSIEVGDFIYALAYSDNESFCSEFLQQIDRYELLNSISHHSSFEGKEEATMGEQNINEEITPEKILAKFTINLTERASNNEFDPLIGREDELKRTIQVLLRRKKNNPIHVGEPGVGKTAISEGLAQMIVKGETPEELLGYQILKLDMSSMVAGTKFRGDFEEKMKALITALEKVDKTILFIDEIHTIVGAGSAGNSNIDAANMLKDVLTSGKMKCIGATTYSEYKKYFEKDSALSRRFQKIDIPEPSILETIEILKGLSKKYEEFHKVKYSEDAIKAAVELSVRYINERFLPDKAIDLIDEAGSMNKLSKNPVKTIKKEQIENVISLITNKKEINIKVDQLELVKNLKNDISKEIYGQESAIEEVTRAVKKAKAGFKSFEKPIASFLFVGPTGVGKTELARVLSKKLDLPLHRFDMSEYQEKHTVAKLFGAPPGYVGYEEGGLLTEAVRRQPNCILLLDEIEKAHPDIYNSLLQIMDYATMTDSTGKKANFRNAIIIMTSNAGAKKINKVKVGFGERKEQVSVMKDSIDKTFPPEFRNRLDGVVYFSHISPEIMKNIVKKNVNELCVRLADKNIKINLSEKALEYLARVSFSADFGARETARIIEDKLEKLLLDEILFGKFKKGGKINIDEKGENLFIL